ncbi:hypothetical protein [Helicobacter himalayensis]|uniref:hypothetical protein n=1 Tax=Helicobacter himalayensis TaxID=1591088 RepID=UPI00083053B0|nr:hypothetical protein [Helicobacter himalayensis]
MQELETQTQEKPKFYEGLSEIVKKPLGLLKEKRADEQKLKEELNNYDAFSASFDFDNAKTAKELNKEITEQAKKPFDVLQEGTPFEEVSQKSYYQKVRNTGIGYFDNKKELGLFDAFMAKRLGLDPKYVFHKIDLTSDNTHRVQSYKKNMENIVGGIKNAQDSVLIALQMGDKGTKDALKKMGINITGGFYQSKGGRDYELATAGLRNNLMYAQTGGGRRVFASDAEDARGAIKTFENQVSTLSPISRIIDKTLLNLKADMINYKGSGARQEQINAVQAHIYNLESANKIIKTAKAEGRKFTPKEVAELMGLMDIADI